MSANNSKAISEAQLEQCYTSANINGLTLKNRFIKASTFENMTPRRPPHSED
jgi:2,4-dienoyl-CoA reductase-like NADH-dependent reductase (Old Yellow Enzyme family)